MGSLLRYRLDTLDPVFHRFHYQARYHHFRNLLLLRTTTQHRRVPKQLLRSCFLSGPKQQVKDMFKKTRWLLTLLYLGSLIATLLLAFLLPDNWKGLVLVTLIVQMISYFLYTFSYVPFGRKILKKFCQCILTMD